MIKVMGNYISILPWKYVSTVITMTIHKVRKNFESKKPFIRMIERRLPSEKLYERTRIRLVN